MSVFMNVAGKQLYTWNLTQLQVNLQVLPEEHATVLCKNLFSDNAIPWNQEHVALQNGWLSDVSWGRPVIGCSIVNVWAGYCHNDTSLEANDFWQSKLPNQTSSFTFKALPLPGLQPRHRQQPRSVSGSALWENVGAPRRCGQPQTSACGSLRIGEHF